LENLQIKKKKSVSEEYNPLVHKLVQLSGLSKKKEFFFTAQEMEKKNVEGDLDDDISNAVQAEENNADEEETEDDEHALYLAAVASQIKKIKREKHFPLHASHRSKLGVRTVGVDKLKKRDFSGTFKARMKEEERETAFQVDAVRVAANWRDQQARQREDLLESMLNLEKESNDGVSELPPWASARKELYRAIRRDE
jgi:hypothetical protein